MGSIPHGPSTNRLVMLTWSAVVTVELRLEAYFGITNTDSIRFGNG